MGNVGSDIVRKFHTLFSYLKLLKLAQELWAEHVRPAAEGLPDLDKGRSETNKCLEEQRGAGLRASSSGTKEGRAKATAQHLK